MKNWISHFKLNHLLKIQCLFIIASVCGLLKFVVLFQVAALIVKHGEQKEAFLKACTLARRTAETFLKYAARSAQVHGQTAAASKAHHEQTRAILDTLLAQENKVSSC